MSAATYSITTKPIYQLFSFQLYILADAYRRLGSYAAAMRAVDRAAEAVEETNEHRWESEIYRLKAILLEANGQDNTPEVELFLKRAVETARDQSAKWFELRAARDLARHLFERGKMNEARELLAPVYHWFTEGLNTLNLNDAKALLHELA